MNILFDQGTPRPLRHYLAEHSVDTAAERGWSDLDNGDLLEAAEDEGYDLLITTDQNIRHQQDLANRSISIMVLLSTAWPPHPVAGRRDPRCGKRDGSWGDKGDRHLKRAEE